MVYAETRRNAIPHLRLGRYVRYRRSAIEDWMRAVERGPGDENSAGGLTRAEAERRFRKLQEAEERRPIRAGVERHTLDEVIDSHRRRLAVGGARKSYLQNCESMQRVHIRLGSATSPSTA